MVYLICTRNESATFYTTTAAAPHRNISTLHVFHKAHNTTIHVWLEVVVFNATFNNISVISWRSVLLMAKPECSEKTTVTDNLYHIMLYRMCLAWAAFELATLVMICTDCIGSCKSNYYTILTTTIHACIYVTRIIQRPLSAIATRRLELSLW